MAKPSRTLRYKVLMVVVLLVIVAWSVLWFTAAAVVDRHAEKAQHSVRDQGAIAECINRSVTGFPFRIEVRCDHGSRVGGQMATLTIDGLTAAALIYNPSRLIVEARSPVVLSQLGHDDVVARWGLAHASARLDLSDRALDRFDAEIQNGAIEFAPDQPIDFTELDVNARRNPSDQTSMDIAVRLSDVRPLPGALPASLNVRGTLHDGAALLSADPNAALRALARKGLTVTLDSATVESGPMLVSLTGEMTLSANGTMNGALEVALAGYGDELPYLSDLAPSTAETVQTLLGNLLAFAPEKTVGGRTAKTIALTVKDGQVSAGLIPLFKIPPVGLPRFG
ncbi:MAG: DUF2125 domain-containing protein [Pseudomonadota bacterium]